MLGRVTGLDKVHLVIKVVDEEDEFIGGIEDAIGAEGGQHFSAAEDPLDDAMFGDLEEDGDAVQKGDFVKEMAGEGGGEFVATHGENGGNGDLGIEVGGVGGDFGFGFTEQTVDMMPIEGSFW